MKKTIIALMALSSFSWAGSLTLTTGIKYTNGQGEATIYNGYTDPNIDAIGYSSAYGSTSRTLSSLSFEITLGELYGGNAIADTDIITLNSLVINVTGTGWCQDNGRTITLSTGAGAAALTYTSELEDVFSGEGASDYSNWNREGYLTLKPKNWTNLTKSSVITVTIATANGKPDTLSIGSADTYVKEAYRGDGVSVAWSGVTTVDMSDNWGYEAPLVKLSVTTVPEPTTATLSLLALAGLFARRRRK